MKKIFYIFRNGKGFSIYMDNGLRKALLFFLLIFFLHDLVDKGDNGFAVSIIEWFHVSIWKIGFLMLAIYVAWKALSGEYPINIKKETED